MGDLTKRDWPDWAAPGGKATYLKRSITLKIPEGMIVDVVGRRKEDAPVIVMLPKDDIGGWPIYGQTENGYIFPEAIARVAMNAIYAVFTCMHDDELQPISSKLGRAVVKTDRIWNDTCKICGSPGYLGFNSFQCATPEKHR